jgi:hypothetical protein
MRGPKVGKVAVGTCAIILACVLLPSCQVSHGPGDRGIPLLEPAPGEKFVQTGSVTVRAGDDTVIGFPTPFAAPPQITIVEFERSQATNQPYSKADFEFIKVEPSYFQIQNNHGERTTGSFATLRWRAEGIKGDPKASSGAVRKEPIHIGVARLAGTVSIDARVPLHPALVVDLHQSRVSDDDLAMFEGQAVRSLNLYGTNITDAGLAHLAGLSDLQTLNLNDTEVGDAGLEQLRGLPHLKELSVFHTRVTDAGLEHLQGMTSLQILTVSGDRITNTGLAHLAGLSHLQNLTVSGEKITDKGLQHLKGLRELHELFLTGTSVTDAGVEDLRKALPKVRVAR